MDNGGYTPRELAELMLERAKEDEAREAATRLESEWNWMADLARRLLGGAHEG